MARISDYPNSDEWAVSSIRKRDFRHDHSGPEEMPHRPKRGKGTPRKKPGCPENEGNAHIYAWIEYHARYRREAFGLSGKAYWVDTTWYEQQCVGCGKVHNRRYVWWDEGKASPDGIEIYERREARHPWYY